ncbi:MAG: D-amino acid aminotransferase [Clostridiales bacterium]|nr:D-amino acid aminotransferase [Clostridiales bacterium]
MKDLAYYNGNIAPIADMMIPMNDRAVYFGDGVYDVAYVHNHRPFALMDHVDRFFSSCALLEIAIPYRKPELAALLTGLIDRLDGDIMDAVLYFQMSRGTDTRSHAFPAPGVAPNLLIYLKAFDPHATPDEFRLITLEDTRFLHCNIKSLNLIPNVIATQRAKEKGCDECVLHRGEHVTECAHSGLSILTRGSIVTTPLSGWVLPSITRKHLLETAAELGVPVEERLYTLRELTDADEIIVTSSLTLFTRVYEIDGQAVGGRDRPLYQRLAETYRKRFLRETESET